MVASTILKHWDIFKKEKFNIVRFPIYFKFLLVIMLKPDINKIGHGNVHFVLIKTNKQKLYFLTLK
jgi:hypothetical protein